VSPSWRDRWLIGLAPAQVALVQLRRGLKPTVGMHGTRACEETAGSPWAGAVAALDALLDEAGARGGEARIVLSNQFVRYVDVPWTPGIRRERDRVAMASECLRAVHGDVVSVWQVSLHMPVFGQGGIAAAIDLALLENLRACCGKRQLRLVCLRPHLAAAMAQCRDRLEMADGGFVMSEPGCVTALFRRGQGWGAVANRRYQKQAADEAMQALRQCVDADTLQGGEGAVALMMPEVKTEKIGERPLRVLKGVGGPWPNDPWRAMAWSAA
jgi:hypothetical protein